MSDSPAEQEPRAIDVLIGDEGFTVRLADGRGLFVPWDWSKILAAATPDQRRRWRLCGRGQGIQWPDVDEDLSVAGLLRGSRASLTR